MSKYEAVRVALEQQLTALTKRAAQLEQDLRQPQNQDWQERAVEIENDEVLEGLDASTLAEVQQIQQALGRIEDGSYGRCTRCRQPIADARLRAMPHAALCIECAS